MGGLFQPINQVKFTNVAIVKYKYKGKKFEIACYKNKIVDWRDGVELNLDDVLQSPLIFTNISKGEVAKKAELFSCFNTEDNYEICKTILDKGTLQISSRERHMLKEKIHKDIVEILHGMCVNPQTGYPLSTNMIENMLKDVGYSINIDDSAKRQALKVFDILSKNYDNLIQRAFMRIQIICDEFLKNDLVNFLNTHSVIFEENKTSQHLKREDSGISKDGESHGEVGNLQNKKQSEETEKGSESEYESENESGKYVKNESTRKEEKKKDKIKEDDYDDDEEEEEKDDDEHEETETEKAKEKEKEKEKENEIPHDTDTVTEIVNDTSHTNEIDEVDKTNEDTDSKREFQENEGNDLVMEEDKEKNLSAKLQKEKNHSIVKKEEDISDKTFDEDDLKKKNKKKKNKKKEVEKKETKHSEKHKVVFLCYPYLYKYIDEYVQKNKKYYSCKILNSNVKIATIRKVKTDVEHVPSKNFGQELEEKDKKVEMEPERKKGKGKGKGKSKLRGRNDSDDERERKKKELEEAQIAAREEQLKKLAEAEIRIRAGNEQTNNGDNNILNQDNRNVTCIMMCSSCVMRIPKSEYKMHCRSDFHVFNAKRKYKNLPPVTLEEYREIDFDSIHFRVDT